MRTTTAIDDERNRLLRRVDWRFLGGAPAPELSVVYMDGTLNEAVRAVSKRTVDGRVTTVHQEADLAVASDPDPATLRAAWQALRPGGTCYTEWTSRSACLAASVRRRLGAAGFVDVTLYTPRPPSEERSPEVWMPLGSSSAARWYLRRADDDAGIRARLARVARRAGWRAAEMVPVAMPVCAVARRRAVGDRNVGPLDEGHDLQRVRRRAIRRARPDLAWQRLFEPAWVLLTPGESSLNKVVLLALDDHGSPDCAMKLPRTALAADGIRREAAALAEVRRLNGDLPGVPRVLLSGECAGVPFVVESPVDGVPLLRLVHGGEIDAVAMKAVAWQAGLVRRGERSSRSCRERVIDPVLRYVEKELGAIADRELIEMTRTALSTLPALPVASEQRDFSPWNVFVTTRGELAVADWESAEPRGLPALDLIYFLTYLTVARERAWPKERLVDAHRATLMPATPAGDLTRRCLSSYTDLVGIDPAAIGPLRVLCWLIHSHSEYQCTTRERGAAPSPSELRNSVFVALWEQEVKATLRVAA